MAGRLPALLQAAERDKEAQWVPALRAETTDGVSRPGATCQVPAALAEVSKVVRELEPYYIIAQYKNAADLNNVSTGKDSNFTQLSDNFF